MHKFGPLHQLTIVHFTCEPLEASGAQSIFFGSHALNPVVPQLQVLDKFGKLNFIVGMGQEDNKRATFQTHLLGDKVSHEDAMWLYLHGNYFIKPFQTHGDTVAQAIPI